MILTTKHPEWSDRTFKKLKKLSTSVKNVTTKVNLPLYHDTKTCGGAEVQRHAFLTSALDGYKRSASRSGGFTRKKRDAGIHWIGNWVDPKACLDLVVSRKISSPLPGIELRSLNP
jgi:hypothetical protein